MKPINIKAVAVLILTVLTVTTACGKKSSDDPVATTPVTGTVFAAQVAGASVVVKDASGNAIAGPVIAAADGTYTVNVPTSALSSTLLLESNGGAFNDEATGTSTTAGALAAYVTSGSLTATQVVNLDPSSTIVHTLVTKSSKTFGEANTIFSSAFGYTPDTTVAPKNAPTSGSDSAQRLAGFRAGVFSQLTKDMSLTPDKQFDLLAAIALDLADDGLLNASAGTVSGSALPENLQNRYEHALITYQSDTTHNLTGITPAQFGSMPFARIALTETYRVEYIAGAMAAAKGKTSFKIKVTKRTDGSAGTGLSVMLMPMMHMGPMGGMSDMMHSTPADSVTESSTPGTYNCTAYYLMGSGMNMGYWELKVKIGMPAETATFYPAVNGMSMSSDTISATLYGQTDIVTSMSGTQYTNYYLFMDGMVSAATPTLKLFISHAEMAMGMPRMSFVPATTGAILSNPTGTVTAMTVEASTDNATWLPATNSSTGHWSVSGLSGLVSSTTSTVYVRMSVNTEAKTTDGLAFSDTNSAKIRITPGM